MGGGKRRGAWEQCLPPFEPVAMLRPTPRDVGPRRITRGAARAKLVGGEGSAVGMPTAQVEVPMRALRAPDAILFFVVLFDVVF